MANNLIKINCVTPETYKKQVRYFKDKNILYHTYQLKEETAYRIAIKYLHHSTNTENIKQELSDLGHNVRNNKCTTQNYQGGVKLVLCTLRTRKKITRKYTT